MAASTTAANIRTGRYLADGWYEISNEENQHAENVKVEEGKGRGRGGKHVGVVYTPSHLSLSLFSLSPSHLSPSSRLIN